MEIAHITKPHPETGLVNSKLGVWLFLASEVMLFGALFSSYIIMRIGSTTWPHGYSILNVPLATVNTFALISSSVTIVLAWASLKLNDFGKFRMYMGATIALSTPAVAGATYAWTGPNSFTSSAQNPTIPSATAAMAGTYNVTVTVSGCTSAAGTTSVVVNPRPATPVIAAPASVSPGQDFTASVPPLAGVTYAWTVTNGTVTAGAGTSQISVTADLTGPVTISIIETDAVTGCASTEASVSIPVVLGATRFYPLAPCRLFDTRLETGESAAGPALAPVFPRTCRRRS